MVNLPEEVFQALNNPKAGKVLATVTEEGTPHVIQVGSVMSPSPDKIAFGAVLMKRSGKNLEKAREEGKKISILVTAELKSYEVHAKVLDFVTKGPIFDRMNEFLKAMGLQASGVWMVEPTDVWNQSASYEAGKQMV
jgi:hypothetical protein